MGVLPRAAGLVLLSLAAAGGASLRGDWLLMKDGSRLETRGGWEVRGQQVMVTLPNGTLAAVGLDKVDLEGSARITAAARAPKPAATPPARKPVHTLTDADLAPAARRPAEETPPVDTGGAAVVGGGGRAAAGASGLELVSWTQEYDPTAEVTRLTGTIRNVRDTLAYNVGVVASIFDREGKLLSTSDARLSVTGLAPGMSTSFTREYPGALTIGDAKFELKADRVITQGGRPSGAAGAEEAAGSTDAPARRLQIGAWRADPAAPPGTVMLVGQLTNVSTEVAYDVSLDVALRGVDGTELASAQALMGARTLQPGEATSFRVSFPGVTTFADAAFSSRHNVRRDR